MTKSVRIDPLADGETAAAAPVPVQETAATQVVSRMTNTVVGQCPICQKNMPIVQAANIMAYVCEEDCVCLPTLDQA